MDTVTWVKIVLESLITGIAVYAFLNVFLLQVRITLLKNRIEALEKEKK